MIYRADIVNAARECLGTKFHHQGRLCGVGIDCVGLLVHVASKLKIEFTDHLQYSKRPNPQTLTMYMEMHFNEKRGMASPGDIISFWVSKVGNPTHVAIKTDKGIIHSNANLRRVVEHGFCQNDINDYWGPRVHRVYEVRGVEPWLQ